jgi:hypothetical protein
MYYFASRHLEIVTTTTATGGTGASTDVGSTSRLIGSVSSTLNWLCRIRIRFDVL